MYPKKLNYEYNYSWRYFESFNNNNDIYADQLISKNYSIGLHTHSFYEIDVVLNGSAKIYIGNKSFDAEKGGVFVIKPGTEHGFLSGEQFDVYHLLIRREFLNSCPRTLLDSNEFSLLFDIEPDFHDSLSQMFLLKLPKNSITKLMNLIQIAEQFKTLDNAGYTTIGFMNIIAFLSAEMHNYHNLELPNSADNAASDIAKALKYIHDNYDQKLTVSMLANKANMSRSTFLRHFQKYCGCTPFEYLKKVRISKYDELLSRGLSKTEAAISSGFYDASHANKSKFSK